VSHIPPRGALHHESRNRKLPDVVRGVLIADLEPLRDLLDGEFGVALEEVEYLKPAMIRKSFYDALHGAIRPLFHHPAIIQTFCKTFECCGDRSGGGNGS